MEKQAGTGGFHKASIRNTIFIYFTVSALVMILLIGVSLYSRLSGQLAATVQEENQAVINQVNLSVDSFCGRL